MDKYRQINALVAQELGLSSSDLRVDLRKPIDVQSNRLYDVWVGNRHLIAKEFLKPDELEVSPVREYNALLRLAPLDIAPQPVFYDLRLAPIVVYEFMEGEMWDRRRPSPEELRQLAQGWLQMHQVSTEDIWPSNGHDRTVHSHETRFAAQFQAYAEWAKTEFLAGRYAAERCLQLMKRWRSVADRLAEYTPVCCFCRADTRFANVIQRPDGRIGLIDWEDSGLRDPARDLADLLTHANHEDLLEGEEWKPFFDAYLEGRRESDPSLLERTHLYLALFPLFWLAILLNAGLKRAKAGETIGWQTNGIPANLRLRRYLARAQAWPERDFRASLEALSDVTFFP